ncbi:MAG TPA: ATP-binding cassette domain-containing protein [Spongiibacteraceae bacterium]|nr:ATP-binding cassette domain-containing protein [Spongiibacteraceae bacterium]
MIDSTSNAAMQPEASAQRDIHIDVRGVTMQYGGRIIQRDLNFSIYRGDVFVIMGGSGCGKSTLLRHMIGLLQPATGQILVDGEDFFAATPERQLEMRRHWGITYQRGGLFGDLTLAENVAVPLQQYTRLTRAEIRDTIAYKLALVGLAGFEEYYPSEISGGMQKRAALARALALDPELLFFDEPSAGLDPLSSQRLDELIMQIRESMGGTVVIVTHELASIFAIATNSVFLDADSRTQLDYGNPRELLKHSEHDVVRRFLSRGNIGTNFQNTGEPV